MLPKDPSFTAEFVRGLLRYNPETGELFWKRRPVEMFADGPKQSQLQNANAWNGRYAGKLAFTSPKSGYRIGSILTVAILAHRVIWLIMTGSWPDGEVDHIDTVRSNNKWVNLRDSTRMENSHNCGPHSNSTTGLKGVSYDKFNCKWTATVFSSGKAHWLGRFDDPRTAHAAYAEAATRLHGEFARAA